jgi:heme/copper-type cytochrome/quinol oxidase subunit 3
MENLFLFAIFTTAFFVLLKIVEMKTLEKEMKPLKFVVRDATMAFTASLAAAFAAFYMRGSVSDFMNIVTENKVLSTETTQIFTDAPGF